MLFIKIINNLNKKLLFKIKIFSFFSFFIFGVYSLEYYLHNEFLKKSRIEKYFEIKKKNNNVFISYYPRNLLTQKNKFLPLGNFPNSLIIDCNEDGDFFIFNSDKNGFNNKNIQWEKDNINIILGDELVLGSCLNKKNFSTIISQNYNSLNLSNRGAGPITEYAILKEYSPIKKIKNVFWFLNRQNDILDLNLEIKNEILIKYLKEDTSQNLLSRDFSEDIKNIILAKIEDEIQHYLKVNNYNFLKFISLSALRYQYRFSDNIKKSHKKDLKEKINLEVYFYTVNKVNSFLKQNNINLTIILTPLSPYYNNLDSILNNNHILKIKNFLKTKKIKFINLEDEIEKKKIKRKKLFVSNHPRSMLNETGHKFVSSIIIREISNLNGKKK